MDYRNVMCNNNNNNYYYLVKVFLQQNKYKYKYSIYYIVKYKKIGLRYSKGLINMTLKCTIVININIKHNIYHNMILYYLNIKI